MKRAEECSLKLDASVYCHGGSLSALLLKLYREFRHMDQASNLAIEGLALEMLAESARLGVKSSVGGEPLWLMQACELLHEQFCEHLTIAEVASAVGVHPVHLAREFRAHYRCTIGQYIRHLRIEHACIELRKSNASLAAIAAAAGFCDQSHFTRTFKRLVGLTPAQYRETVSYR